MRVALFFLFTVISIGCFAQNPINFALKRQLDTILRTDQGIREFMDSEVKENRKDELAKFLNYPRTLLDKHPWTIARKIDSINIEKVELIIAKYGYPGRTLVGEPENTAVFYVIQHSKKIPKYYALIEQAGKDKELPFKYTALMLDRKLAAEGKEQVYGTQINTIMIDNNTTGKKESFSYVVPIKHAKNVNKRRKEAGFITTVEAAASSIGVVYKEYTIKQIRAVTTSAKIIMD